MKAHRTFVALALTAALGLAACGDDDDEPSESSGGGESSEQMQDLSGEVRIDGSSTVQPFAEAASELFQEQAPNVQITVGGAGTGDGFERFCRGETDISDASRPIEDDETEACAEGNVEFSEVRVATDGLSVVVNPDLDVDCFTTAQLEELLGPDSDVTNLSEVDASFPDTPVRFFTPGTESGTYDYFTEEVLDTDGEQRRDDVQTSADDNTLIQGIAGTEGGIGYLGFSFAEENSDQVKTVQVDGGDGCVAPTLETIQGDTYTPLSRPLFMYPKAEALQRPEVKAFMDFVLENEQRIAEAAAVVPLTDEQLTEARAALQEAEQAGAAG